MNYTHFAASIFTPVKVGAASVNNKLHSVTINTKGAAANLLTLADNAGTIAIIDTVNINSQTLIYDIDTQGPLTVASATGTGADVTIAWQ